MRVLLQMRKFSGGPSVFRKRLNEALRKIDGIKVVHSLKDKFDIELSFIRILAKHRKPHILRIDGCYYKPGEVKKRNNELKKSILSSKRTIFQSNFSKDMVCNILKIKPKSTVIMNGIDMDYINKIPKREGIEPGSFVSVAKWRVNKRPNSIIKGFLEADTGRHLYMLGDHNGIDRRLKNTKNVHCLGPCSEDKSISIMKSCKYMLHICHIDSCPNAVIEGLASGCNVLCTNLGGTKELVQNDGIVLNIDRWNYKPNNFKNIDKIDPRVVAKGICDLMDIETTPCRPDLDMNHVANKYANVLKEIL